MIFQDSYASLNPRWCVANIVAEPITTQGLWAAAAETRAAPGRRLTGTSGPVRQRQRISICKRQGGVGQESPFQLRRRMGGARERILMRKRLRAARHPSPPTP